MGHFQLNKKILEKNKIMMALTETPICNFGEKAKNFDLTCLLKIKKHL